MILDIYEIQVNDKIKILEDKINNFGVRKYNSVVEAMNDPEMIAKYEKVNQQMK